MATNIKRYFDRHFAMPVVVTHPAAPDSGDPVRYGVLTGVALTDEGDGGNAATETTVWFGPGVVAVPVKGINNDGNSAVAAGDAIYYVDADTPPLSKKAAGHFFGFARGAVGSGLTATIEVIRTGTPGLAITVEDQVSRSLSVDVPAASAGDASAVLKALAVFSENVTITAVNFIPATAQAGQNTNTATLALRNVGTNGAGTTNLVTFAQTSGNDFAANVPASFGSTLANETVTAGHVLAWHRTLTASGVASPAGQVIIEYQVSA